EDPYPTYRWLRDERPVYRNERLDFWALSRYHDVVEASRDWATYSSAEGTTLERLDPRVGEYLPMMIFMDPPRQTSLRALLRRAPARNSARGAARPPRAPRPGGRRVPPRGGFRAPAAATQAPRAGEQGVHTAARGRARAVHPRHCSPLPGAAAVLGAAAHGRH